MRNPFRTTVQKPWLLMIPQRKYQPTMVSTMVSKWCEMDFVHPSMAVVVKTNGIPFWARYTTHFSLFYWGLGCSLGVPAFDPWPYRSLFWRVPSFYVGSGLLWSSVLRHPHICPLFGSFKQHPLRQSSVTFLLGDVLRLQVQGPLGPFKSVSRYNFILRTACREGGGGVRAHDDVQMSDLTTAKNLAKATLSGATTGQVASYGLRRERLQARCLFWHVRNTSSPPPSKRHPRHPSYTKCNSKFLEALCLPSPC